MIKKEIKASYTVEAALVFPIVFFVIIGLIYLGFYLHDENRINSLIHLTLMKGKYLIETETDMYTGQMDYETYTNRGFLYSFNEKLEEKKDRISEYLEQQLIQGLFIAEVQDITIAASHSDLKMEVKVQMKIPIFGVREFFTGSDMPLKFGQAWDMDNPMEFIRIFSTFSGVAEKVPLIEKGLTSLQKLLNP